MRTRWAVLACLVLPLFVYAGSLRAPFIFDDYFNIVDNPDIRGAARLVRTWSHPVAPTDFRGRAELARPVTFLTFAWSYTWGGLRPSGYRLFNLALHLLNTLLVFFLARWLLGRSGFRSRTLLPLASALFFGLHPAHADVVTYVSNRSDALATLFYLLGLLCFVRSAESSSAWFPAAAVCCALSFFSKQIGITLPLAVLLTDYFFLAEGRADGILRRKFQHGTLWLLAAAFFCFQRFYSGQLGLWTDQALLRWTPASYLGVQPYVFLRYLELWFAPFRLCIDHDLRPQSVGFWTILLSAAAVIALVAAAWRRPAVEFRRPVRFSIAWLFAASLPTSVVPISDALVDRRLYLPGVGLALLVPCLALALAGEGAAGLDDAELWNGRKRIWAWLGVYLLVLSGAAAERNLKFNFPDLIWQEAVELYPRSDRAWNNFGLSKYQRGETGPAEAAFRKALELDPKQDDALVNLGKLLEDRKDYDGALRCYEKAIALNPLNPKAYTDAGTVHVAKAGGREAGRLNPGPGPSYNDKGVPPAGGREYDQAERCFLKATEIQPKFADAWYNLGLLAYERGRLEESVRNYRRAIELDPDYVQAHFNLGVSLYRLGDRAGALASLRRALELAPDIPQISDEIKIIQARTPVSEPAGPGKEENP